MDHKAANLERFKALASVWDEDPKRVRMAQGVAEAMLAALSPSGSERALEFGAGTGAVTLVMAPRLGHVVAMDASPDMLSFLRQKCEQAALASVEVVEGAVPDELPGGTFDLIYSSMTLHHVEDVPGLFEALARHMKPGGRVALADLDAEDGSFHGDGHGVAHHGFSRASVKAWLEAAGFEEIALSDAFKVRREGEGGATREYPIFLAVATWPRRT